MERDDRLDGDARRRYLRERRRDGAATRGGGGETFHEWNAHQSLASLDGTGGDESAAAAPHRAELERADLGRGRGVVQPVVRGGWLEDPTLEREVARVGVADGADAAGGGGVHRRAGIDAVVAGARGEDVREGALELRASLAMTLPRARGR